MLMVRVRGLDITCDTLEELDAIMARYGYDPPPRCRCGASATRTTIRTLTELTCPTCAITVAAPTSDEARALWGMTVRSEGPDVAARKTETP